MSVSEEYTDKKVWELVKQIEHVCDERTNELKEAVATLDVNFGEEGKKAKGVINTSQRVAPMIVSALKWYEAENARLNGTLEFVRATMLNNCIDCKDSLDDDCERCLLKDALAVIGKALNGKEVR